MLPDSKCLIALNLMCNLRMTARCTNTQAADRMICVVILSLMGLMDTLPQYSTHRFQYCLMERD